MKIFRDPIHNVIDLDTGDKGINELRDKLICNRAKENIFLFRKNGEFSTLLEKSEIIPTHEGSFSVDYYIDRGSF